MDRTAVIGFVALLLAFLRAVAYWRMPGRQSGCGILIVLHVLAIAALAAFFWVIFCRDRVIPASGAQTGKTILILKDVSESMNLPNANGDTRREFADKTVELVSEILREQGPADEAQVLHYIFAGRVVEGDGQLRDADPAQSRPFLAQELVAGRIAAGAVLSLTDACTDSESGQGIARSQAENRGVKFYAVACCDAVVTDISVLRIEVEKVDPDRVTGQVNVTGELVGRNGSAELLIDGSRIAEKVVEFAETQMITFPIPELTPGWHILRFRMVPLEGEIVVENNERQCVFEVTADDAIVLFCGRPDSETTHLVRLLKADPGSSLQVFRQDQAADVELNPAKISLIIIANIDSERVPPAMEEVVRRKTIPVLFLGNADWDGWNRYGLPALSKRPLVANDPQPLLPGGFFRMGLQQSPVEDCLKTCRILQVDGEVKSLQPGIMVEFSGRQLPVMLLDRFDRPRLALCLLDTTWPWKLSPVPATRIGYDLFWSEVVHRMRSKHSGALSLQVKLDSIPETGVQAIARWFTETTDLSRRPDVYVRITGETGQERLTKMSYVEDASEYMLRGEYKTPGEVEWWQAEAEIDGIRVVSERQPVFREGFNPEILDPVPSEAVLRALGTTPDRGTGFYTDRQRIIERMVDELPAVPVKLVRERSFSTESIFAAIAVLLLATEWLLERRLRRS